MKKKIIPSAWFFRADERFNDAEALTRAKAKLNALRETVGVVLDKLLQRVKEGPRENLNKGELLLTVASAGAVSWEIHSSYFPWADKAHNDHYGHVYCMATVRARKRGLVNLIVETIKLRDNETERPLWDALCDTTACSRWTMFKNHVSLVVDEVQRFPEMAYLEIGYGRSEICDAVNRLAEIRAWESRLEGPGSRLTDVSDDDDFDLPGPSRYIAMDANDDVWYRSCTGNTIARFHGTNYQGTDVTIWHRDGTSYSMIEMSGKEAASFNWKI